MSGFQTLFYKELLRFWKVSFLTVLAPIVTALSAGAKAATVPDVPHRNAVSVTARIPARSAPRGWVMCT